MNSVILFHLLITEITAVIGAITGSASLGIVIYKTLQDKPNLDFEVKQTYYVREPEPHNFTNFHITVRIHNKGGKNTTVYESILSFKLGDKTHNLVSSNLATSVPPDSSDTQHFMFGLNKREGIPTENIKNANITIKTTHEQKIISIDNINSL
ncbi:MAG: hypothetical protein JRZ94_03575 [Nitrososphaerota archaeon]|nr:hypothetical protein [Nitrososphaerota archaeon]